MNTQEKIAEVVRMIEEMGFSSSECLALVDELNAKMKPSTLNKDGTPRKAYTRRNKIESNPVKESKSRISTFKPLNPGAPRLNYEILYEGGKRSFELLDAKILGIFVPYRFNNNKSFVWAFKDEKGTLPLMDAIKLARSRPKVLNNSWIIPQEKHRESLEIAKEKINAQLKLMGGDLYRGKYILNQKCNDEPNMRVHLVLEI